jgi:ABC-2 type transport system permease protein
VSDVNDARIHDVGYRPYDGPRGGLGHAVLTLAVHTIQRVLGLKRELRHKLLPAVSLVIAFLPALVFIGMAAFLPRALIEEDILPSYGDYYGFIASAVMVFSALVAPEALCTDRRTGMLGLYLASPLDRPSYLAGKAGAIVTLLCAMTVAPLLMLLGAYTIEGAGPDGVLAGVELLVRIVLAGVVMAAYFGSLTMAIAATTPRRTIASAVIVLVLLVTAAVTGILVEARDAAPEIALTDLFNLPFEAARTILDDRDVDEEALTQIDGALVVGATLAWTALAAFATLFQFRRVAVTR